MEEDFLKLNNIFISLVLDKINHLEINMPTLNIVLIQLQKRNYLKFTQI